MISFFRRIRQKLFDTGNIKKYLLYAFGEIILVVIGILIAVQINNWNESKKLEEKKQQYYDQLLSDIATDTTNIHYFIRRIESSINSYETYVETFTESDIAVETTIENLNKVEYTYPIITFYTNTITTLKETGDLKLIPTNIQNSLLDILRLQSTVENQRNQLDPAYLSLLTEARKLGFSPLSKRISNQSKLSEVVKIEENAGEIILTMEAAYSLKNWVEINRLESFNNLLIKYRNLEKLIMLEKE